jgi:hypothetical protein
MWNYYKSHQEKKKPKKLFTPYTQRCVEMYMATELEETFILNHALGSNADPLTARAHFMSRRLTAELNEVFPKATIWRVGRSLKVAKSHLRFHKHAVGGDTSRNMILQALSSNNVVFVYHHDVKLMTENNHAFEAFICALTGYLKFRGMTEERPAGFPESETWIDFPKETIVW